jgi:hypothetical protein
MWKALRIFGLCTALIGLGAVRNASGGDHGPLFVDTCELDADFRWFEPIYCDCAEPIRNEGVFFSYERVNWNVLSPKRYAVGQEGLQFASSVLVENDPVVFPGTPGAPPPTPVYNAIDVAYPDSEFGWGNRFEFGYVHNDAGWNVSVLEGFESVDSENYGQDPGFLVDPQPFTGSVAVLFQIPAGLLDGFVDLDLDGVADDVDSDGNLPFGLPADFGDLVTFVPSFDTLQINHRTRADGIEVMRLIRRDDFFARDSTLEFLYGLRFLRVDSEMQVLGTGGLLADSNWLSEVENKLVGPQVGIRWSRSKGRFSLRTQGRFMAALNVRDASLEGTMGSQLLPTVPNNPLYFNPTSFAKYNSDLEFSPLAEARLEAVFRVTKKVSLTAGYTGTYASNLAYGSNMVGYTLPELTLRSLEDMDTQHFFSNGLNVGFEINR